MIEYSPPRFPVRAFEVGQTLADGEPPLWSAAFSNDKYRKAYADTLSAEPDAESAFDIYVDGRTLTYVSKSRARKKTPAGGFSCGRSRRAKATFR